MSNRQTLKQWFALHCQQSHDASEEVLKEKLLNLYASMNKLNQKTNGFNHQWPVDLKNEKFVILLFSFLETAPSTVGQR